MSTPADFALSAFLETIILYCFMGYIGAPTYYLLLLNITDVLERTDFLRAFSAVVRDNLWQRDDRLSANVSDDRPLPRGPPTRRPVAGWPVRE